MSVTVHLPLPLQKLVGDQSEVQVEGATLREVIESLIAQNAEFKRLLNDEGNLRSSYVSLWLNSQDAHFLQKLDTPVQNGDVIKIIAAGSNSLRG